MTDVVVVGAGLSGLVAALRLAEGGLRTVLVTQGVGATHLSPATIDVLGYAPDRVDRPVAALPTFVAEHPEHPYAKLLPTTVAGSIEWFREHVPALGYTGSVEENLLLPTAVGVAKPTAVVPRSMASGDLRGGGRFVFVGLRALKDFHPGYLADNLRQTKTPSGAVDARAVALSDPGTEPDQGPLAYTRLFEDAAFRRAVIDELLPRLEEGESVGFPSVLGLDAHREAWEGLRDGLGRPVFEVPSLPPSVPGIRLYRALREAFRRAGGRFVLGPTVSGAETSRGRVDALVAMGSAHRTTRFEARWFVLATGGFGSGAIDLDSYGEVREAVFGLPVAGVPAVEEPRFLAAYFDEHPMARAGLAVDERMHPLDARGRPAFANLVAAGAVLAGAVPWREQSGNGLALATAFAASSTILEDAA